MPVRKDGETDKHYMGRVDATLNRWAIQDQQRWREVQRNRRLQGSLNGYATFTQTVDAAIEERRRKDRT